MGESTAIADCVCCGYTTEVKTYRLNTCGDVEMCKLCAATLAGNSLEHPNGYGQSGYVMQTVCYVGNVILDAIKLMGQVPQDRKDGE